MLNLLGRLKKNPQPVKLQWTKEETEHKTVMRATVQRNGKTEDAGSLTLFECQWLVKGACQDRHCRAQQGNLMGPRKAAETIEKCVRQRLRDEEAIRTLDRQGMREMEEYLRETKTEEEGNERPA